MNKFILVLLLSLGIGCSAYAVAPAPIVMVPAHHHHSSSDKRFDMELTGCIVKIYNLDGSIKAEGVAEACEGKNGFAIVTIKGQEYVVSVSNSSIEITEENKELRARQREKEATFIGGFLVVMAGAVGCLIYLAKKD